jgi:hypothetical protein
VELQDELGNVARLDLVELPVAEDGEEPTEVDPVRRRRSL